MIKFVEDDHTTVIPPTDIFETPHREMQEMHDDKLNKISGWGIALKWVSIHVMNASYCKTG